MDDITTSFDVSVMKRKLISVTLQEVYNPINQLVGYIISGDPGYISSYKDCRSKILEFDRAEITAIILEEYLDQ